ncbi:MAG TPA: hypothetical protein VK487_06360 [Candidatus Bathyarchaeia archaeon]|nr:hypothetical protein [Candidatus Bathyarchaeia archaeon]
MGIAPEEGRRLKDFITNFLESTHGLFNVSDVVLKSIKKTASQIEVKGTFDGGTLFQVKTVSFTIVVDSNYHLISYERT